MDHNQQSNTPPPNQQNTPPPNQNMAGFGPYSRLLREGMMSPMIPNKPQFSPMQQSPAIPFNQIQQNIHPQNAYFSQNFNDPRTFLQPEFQQPNFYGGGGSGQATQEEEVVPETQPEPTKTKKRASRKKAASGPQGETIIYRKFEFYISCNFELYVFLLWIFLTQIIYRILYIV